MFKYEKRICTWVTDHIQILSLIGITVLAFLVRYYLRGFLSGDADCSLLPWYEEIRAGGGLSALKAQVGDYNIFYQFWIALFTYLPIVPLTAYKLFSCLFDLLLAGLGGYFIFRHHGAFRGTITYAAILFAPIVFLNSSCWAQCDAIYSFFALAALLCLIDEKYLPAFLLLGFSFAFKLQAVFVLPLFLFVYLYRKKFSILYFLCIPAVMMATGIPSFIFGRSPADVFGIYTAQVGSYQGMYWGYPSFWAIISESTDLRYEQLGQAAVMLAAGVLFIFMAALFSMKITLNRNTMLYLAMLFSYTCVFFLPNMHERYDYIPCILAILIAVILPRTIPLAVAIHIVSLTGYTRFLFHIESDIRALGYINTALYAVYVIALFLAIRKEAPAGEKVSATDSAA